MFAAPRVSVQQPGTHAALVSSLGGDKAKARSTWQGQKSEVIPAQLCSRWLVFTKSQTRWEMWLLSSGLCQVLSQVIGPGSPCWMVGSSVPSEMPGAPSPYPTLNYHVVPRCSPMFPVGARMPLLAASSVPGSWLPHPGCRGASGWPLVSPSCLWCGEVYPRVQ